MTLVPVKTAPLPARSVSGLVWRQLVLPVPVDEARMRSVVAALAGLPGSPHLAFEVIGRGGRVWWRLGTEPWALRSVQALLLAHLPGVRLVDPGVHVVRSGQKLAAPREAFLATDTPATTPASTVATVRFTNTVLYPLRTDSTETVTRSLLAVLAGTTTKETVRLQVVCGRRLPPRRYPTTEGAATPSRQVTARLEDPGFQVAVRIGASAVSPSRAHWLVSQTAATLRGLELPPVRLRLWRSTPGALASARSPWLLPLHLRASELPGLLAWPVAEGLPGVASPHPVVLAPSEAIHTNPELGKRIIGEAVSDPGTLVGLSGEDSLRHLHLIGPTGVGKSTLMTHLALADIHAGHAVVVIDPKGDLVADIAARIPDAVLEETVILSGKDSQPVGINPLARTRDPDLAADVLLGVLHSLYADSWGPRTHDILHASLLTLARRGDASLVMVPLLLTNPGFRRSITGGEAKRDPLGLGAFWAWYEALSDGERQQAISPLLNKLRPILLRPQLRAIFGQRYPRFHFSDLFAPGPGRDGGKRPRVVLVNLAKGALGSEAAQLMGSVVVSLVWQAALGRAALQAFGRRPVMLHIDEVQDYLRLPGDLGDALAQARGLGMGLTLAHQHLGQLPQALLRGVMANARSRVAFTLTGDDAGLLAKRSGGLLVPDDYQQLPAFHAYAHLLAGGDLQPPTLIRTTPPAPARRHPNDAALVSRRRYGQSLTDIEADLAALIPGSHTKNNGTSQAETIGRVRRPRASVDPDQKGAAS